MSASEISKFEMALAYHAAPTLMGIKCGSLLSLSNDEFDLSGLAEILSNQLADRGLRIRLIPFSEKRRLVYIYSEEMLKQRLCCKAIRRFLSGYGYAPELNTEQCLDRLSERLSENEFPHEIGIFLDYPLEDVKGFIDNSGQHCKLFGSYGWGDGEWMRSWQERVTAAGAEIVGDEGFIVNDAPSDDDLAKIKALAGTLA